MRRLLNKLINQYFFYIYHFTVAISLISSSETFLKNKINLYFKHKMKKKTIDFIFPCYSFLYYLFYFVI